VSGSVLLALRLVLAAVLYGFLGWAIWVIWQDLRAASKKVVSIAARPITLSYGTGENITKSQFSLPEILIGRDPACDCNLEDKTISAQHARLAYHHGQWWVEDLGSRNGTFLNQEAVIESLVITSGDELRCGQVVFEVSFVEDESGL